MSADYWVVVPKPGSDDGPTSDSLNITRNLTPMMREAGLYNTQADLLGAPVSELAGVADAALRKMLADPARFKALNPENGWGTYETAVEFVTALRDTCAHWSHIPGAVIDGSI